jgi:hypothetical protein
MGEPVRVQKARIIVPVTRATIVLIEVDCCARALWTRPKPTTSVTQANASITTLSAASSEKLFMTCSPKTSLSLVGARWRKVHGYPRQSSAVIFIEAGGSGSGPGRRPARRFRQPTTCMEPLGRAPEPRRSHTARRGFASSLFDERSPLSPAAIGLPLATLAT